MNNIFRLITLFIFISLLGLSIPSTYAESEKQTEIQWTKITQVQKNYYSKILYANGTFVITGDGGEIKTSKDGLNCANINVGSCEYLTGAVWGSNKLLVIGKRAHTSIILIVVEM